MTFHFSVAPPIYYLHLPAKFTWKYLRALSHSSALVEGSKSRTRTHRITSQGGEAAAWCCGRHTHSWDSLPSNQHPAKCVPVHRDAAAIAQPCRQHFCPGTGSLTGQIFPWRTGKHAAPPDGNSSSPELLTACWKLGHDLGASKPYRNETHTGRCKAASSMAAESLLL